MGTFQLSVWDHNSNTAHSQIGLASRDVLIKSLLRPAAAAAAVATTNNNSSSSNAKAVNSNPIAAATAPAATTAVPLEETIKILFTLNHPTAGGRVRERPRLTPLLTHLTNYPINIPYHYTTIDTPNQLPYQYTLPLYHY